MSRPYVSAITPRDAIEVFGNLSQNNHYQVSFNALPPAVEEHIARKFAVYDSNYWMGSKGGIMCSSASLPGTNLATTDVKDNFMGIPQQFAHTRMYTESEFTFYVDRDYTNLRVFEGWIDYISSGSEDNDNEDMDELNANYYRRMRYPNTYKSSTMYITKFEKDIDEGGKRIDYLFVNAFPRAVIAVPVAYGNAEILQVTVQFVYDRYIMNPKGRMGGYKKPVEENFGTFKSAELQQSSAAIQESLGASGEQRNILGNSQSELDQLRRNAYLNSTRGRVFGRSQSARDLDASYGVTRNSRGEEI